MADARKFQPKPGQRDYTHASEAPVVVCVVVHGGKILMLKRSAEIRIYPGRWSGVGGFLDDDKSPEEKAVEEIREETGIEEKDISRTELGETFEINDTAAGKKWIVHPVFVEVGTDKVTLDWESETYSWVEPEKIKEMNPLESFAMAAEIFSDLLKN